MFKALHDIGWKGVVEFDCHMLRAEGDPARREECCKQFIRNCSEAVDIAIALARRIQPLKRGCSQAEADLASIRQMCNL